MQVLIRRTVIIQEIHTGRQSERRLIIRLYIVQDTDSVAHAVTGCGSFHHGVVISAPVIAVIHDSQLMFPAEVEVHPQPIVVPFPPSGNTGIQSHFMKLAGHGMPGSLLNVSKGTRIRVFIHGIHRETAGGIKQIPSSGPSSFRVLQSGSRHFARQRGRLSDRLLQHHIDQCAPNAITRRSHGHDLRFLQAADGRTFEQGFQLFPAHGADFSVDDD